MFLHHDTGKRNDASSLTHQQEVRFHVSPLGDGLACNRPKDTMDVYSHLMLGMQREAASRIDGLWQSRWVRDTVARSRRECSETQSDSTRALSGDEHLARGLGWKR